MKKLGLFFFLILPLLSMAQLKPIGSWTDHLPYRSGSSITTNGRLLYVGTSTGMFTYDIQDGSIGRFSKVNLLNDVGIAELKYNPFNGVLVIVYNNANIDLLHGNQVVNLPFIKDNRSINNKAINDIQFEGDQALLSFGFGIVEINTRRNEITDTYRFGPNGDEIQVNSAVTFNNFIYAGTPSGMYRADRNSNLLDFNNWIKQNFKANNNFKSFFQFNSILHVAVSQQGNNGDSLFSLTGSSFNWVSGSPVEQYVSHSIAGNELVYVTRNNVFYFDPSFNQNFSFPKDNAIVQGVSQPGNGISYFVNSFDPVEQYQNGNRLQTLRPNGPFDKATTSIEVSDGVLWATNGGFDGAYNSSFQFASLYRYEDGTWNSYLQSGTPNLTGAYDVMSVAFNPANNGEVYFGSFGTGMYSVNDALQFSKFDNSNSSLQERQDVVWDGWIGSPDVAFDENNNLWVTNAYTTNCLSSRIGGVWIRYNMSPYISAGTAVTELIIMPSGDKWIAVPRSNQILVFDDKGTYANPGDDVKVLLSSEEGQGNIPGIAGITMERDQKNQIWVGTSDGIAVFFNPDDVFEEGKRDAQRILIEGDENVEILLAGTSILDIAIDGANRKWIATEEAGVYLVSEDGKETIHHFTEENSPLFSNTVTSIGIDYQSGEIYFGTANGIISYRGTATEGADNFADVKIFPNPVRENYRGPIAISGLMDNSTVKITDISGRLVNELRSIGGQAIWDGNTFRGERAATGVYLIFNSAENDKDALKTHVGKILLVN